ncbi:hypothetical protein H7I41_00700 [Mycobacterium manitobense]|uniref:Uncharacterized protein n=1 Tax=[Mycobacterium] manitobense TaxID=190147 RepID=A0A9X2YKV2_9MYCO|nr:hypothetical protein [[Mycobacterium] manitobense]MCV7168432.1 hypothetical protein [[Mycobacterium] manitobense]
MPHLRFYAVDDDHRAVLDAVFGQGDFAVYDMHAEPGRPIGRYRAADEVPMAQHGTHLMLHVVSAGGEPILGGKVIGGWGLVQLSFGAFFRQRELRWSFTNHNTVKTAMKWVATYPDSGSPHDWDFDEVNRASARLNRKIRKLGVDAIGPHPVLPAAAALIDRHGLTHVYGTGVHARPAGQE